MNSCVTTATEFRCQYCERVFRKASSLEVHLCEQKKRRQSQDDPAVRLAFQGFLEFYKQAQGSSRLKTAEDFMTSPYYRAFVKWGHYCVNTRAVDPESFLHWLLAHNHRIDHWAQDSKYSQFLLEHTRREPADRALARALEAAIDWSERTGHPDRDYLRFGNTNAICHAITTGRVTAWTLYNCDSGQEFLANLGPEQIQIVWPWVESDYWGMHLAKFPADRAWVAEILKDQGW